MRAFIFSLDAFVAFALALVAIYSLIFFSSVPSSYYFLLTQAHYLSRDTLLSLSTTPCIYYTTSLGCSNPQSSVIENIAFNSNPVVSANIADSTLRSMIPSQFGYSLEGSSDGGQTWNTITHTADKSKKKVSVSSSVLTYGYTGIYNLPNSSTYSYWSCGDGPGSSSGSGGLGGSGGSPGSTSTGIITCGTDNIRRDPSSGGGSGIPGSGGSGNGSSTGGSGDLVPSSNVKVLRLTVYV
ncbi:MAG: hypothetical protein ACP5N9_00555 [Candidatus Bilamarchaeum sp.]|jgi:hypothetical protein